MDKVKVTTDGQVGIIVLNDPASMNSASDEITSGMRAAFDRFAGDDQVRCVILTGEGRGFCSGANLTGGGLGSAVSGERRELDVGAGLEAMFNPFMTQLRDYPLPIVTAVNGAAAGIGCSLALIGDIVVAAESAYFLQAFRRIGLVPDGGSTYMLPRLVGKARAMEMTLLGDRIPAKTALEWGLINRCVPDEALMPTALELARTLASGPRSMGYIRKLIWDSLDADWAEQLHAERVVQRDAGKTEDFREGVRAFQEKRPAVFKGR
ncbi:MAG TPA: enoyl-CoA hydratase/isomerase [Phenylobacterium sp.]